MVSCQDTTEEPGLYIINFSRLNIAKLRESCWNYRIALSTSCANKAATPLGGILQWKEAGKGNATCTTEALQIKGTACGVFSIFPCINPLVLVQLKCI